MGAALCTFLALLVLVATPGAGHRAPLADAGPAPAAAASSALPEAVPTASAAVAPPARPARPAAEPPPSPEAIQALNAWLAERGYGWRLGADGKTAVSTHSSYDSINDAMLERLANASDVHAAQVLGRRWIGKTTPDGSADVGPRFMALQHLLQASALGSTAALGILLEGYLHAHEEQLALLPRYRIPPHQDFLDEAYKFAYLMELRGDVFVPDHLRTLARAGSPDADRLAALQADARAWHAALQAERARQGLPPLVDGWPDSAHDTLAYHRRHAQRR